MGKALRLEHLTFFTARLDDHSRISKWELIDDEHEYLFRVVRTLSGSTNDVIVHLTDAYRYGLAEFFCKSEAASNRFIRRDRYAPRQRGPRGDR